MNYYLVVDIYILLQYFHLLPFTIFFFCIFIMKESLFTYNFLQLSFFFFFLFRKVIFFSFLAKIFSFTLEK